MSQPAIRNGLSMVGNSGVDGGGSMGSMVRIMAGKVRWMNAAFRQNGETSTLPAEPNPVLPWGWSVLMSNY